MSSHQRTVRLRLTGTLVAISPVRVANRSDGPVVDLELARDGLGRLMIPGTALAGALRSQLVGSFVSTEARDAHPIVGADLWGSGGTHGRASRVFVDDAIAIDEPVLEVRQGVSLNRRTGAAEPGHLFSREHIAPGARFTFGVEIQIPRAIGGSDLHSDAEALLNLIETQLSRGELAVGGLISSGSGLLRAHELTRSTIDFSAAEGVLGFLNSPDGCSINDPGESAGETTLSIKHGAPRPGVVRIVAPWMPTGPILSSAAVVGMPVDRLPLTTSRGSSVHLVLPGTSIKGALRTRAERIERTLRGITADEVPEKLLDQLDDPALEIVHSVFGAASLKGGRGLRGAIVVHETESTQPIDAELWRTTMFDSWKGAAEKDRAAAALHSAVRELNAALAETGQDAALWFDLASRNAIDRWTGGVAEGILYSSIEPYAKSPRGWSPLTFDLDVHLIAQRAGGGAAGVRAAQAGLTLLLFLMRDLAEHRLPLGANTTRGLGDISLDLGPANLMYSPVDENLLPSFGTTGDDGIVTASVADTLAHAELVAALDDAWKVATTPALKESAS